MGQVVLCQGIKRYNFVLLITWTFLLKLFWQQLLIQNPEFQQSLACRREGEDPIKLEDANLFEHDVFINSNTCIHKYRYKYK